MTHLLDKPGAKAEVRKLRDKHWKPLLRRHPDLPLGTLPYETLMLARGGGVSQGSPATEPGIRPPPTTYHIEDDPAFIAYLDAIEGFTAHYLRVTSRGHPPTWALRDVHDRVLEHGDWSTAWSSNPDFWEAAPPSLSPTEPRLRITLEIEATPSGARVICTDATTQDVLSEREVPPSNAYAAFDGDDWQTLEREAIATVAGIALPYVRNAMTRHYAETETEDPIHHNPSSLELMLDDLGKLAIWLSLRIKPDDDVWKRLPHLTRKVLLIDLPPARKKGQK
jgi:hypothetical protein